MIKLIGNGYLITHNDDCPVIVDGCVAVEGNIIQEVGTTTDLRSAYPNSDFYDVHGKWIMPGFINTHGHIYSAFARGMVLDDAPISKNFTEILQNLWWRVDRALGLDEIRSSAYTTYIDCIRNGVTTVIDHHASAGQVKDSLFTIAEVAKSLGIRTSLCYEVSDRDGAVIAQQGIDENAAFQQYVKNQQDDMLHALFGLHASFTLSDETLDQCVIAAEGNGFHIHVAEGVDDVADSVQKYDKRVVQRLYERKILGKKSLAIHCIHIDDDELDLLKITDTSVVHCPESNMGNAVGCADILSMIRKGICVGLGTDGYTTDMLESLKVANIIHKHQQADPSVAWVEAPQMLIDHNAQICSKYFSKPVGIIEKGALADIIVVDYQSPTPITPANIRSHMLFGLMGRNVITTMVNGEYIMKDRQLLHVDEERVYAQSRQIASAFWKRV